MCLIALAWQQRPDRTLVVAANRDEYYARPAAPAAWWEDAPDVLAGRDLEAGGTWLGITRSGRFAALTNVRKPSALVDGGPSRGALVRDFLLGDEPPAAYAERVRTAGPYSGFNLLVGTPEALVHCTNLRPGTRTLGPGLHGLSNADLDTPWPKVVAARDGLGRVLARANVDDPEPMFRLLENRTVAGDDMLPDTGVGREMERLLAPAFIETPVYGTRSSTVLVVEPGGTVRLWERTHGPDGPGPANAFRFDIEPAS